MANKRIYYTVESVSIEPISMKNDNIYPAESLTMDFELERLRSMPLNHVTQKEFDYGISVRTDWAEPEKPKVCTCDIMRLMAVGCKCGQMERERKEGE